MQTTQYLKKSQINTPLGPMIAIGNEKYLYALGFTDQYNSELEIEEHIKKKTSQQLISASSPVIASIARELHEYFSGKLKNFITPLMPLGTPFQRRVWQELSKISIGQTRSYADIAQAVGSPRGYRAVAQANAANPLAIIIGCHRIINANGKLGGYAAGIDRKEWLLHHERGCNINS